jgi:hypothetical protein
MKNLGKQPWVHVAVCIIFLALPLMLAPSPPDGSFNPLRNPPTLRDFIGYALLIVFFYLNYFVLIPRFYFAKKYGLFAVLILACFVVVVFVPHLLTHPFFKPMHVMPPPPDFPRNPPPFRPGPFFFIFENSQHIFLFFAVLFFSLLLRTNTLWKQTEKEKLNAELSFLKAQINPHFLFNALNNIYSLSLEKSDETPDSILKLGAMMRYVFNEATHDLVPLANEISYIKNYIELQQLRFGESVDVSFEVKGSVEHKKIAPLLLIPFVENAFKYGVNAEEDSKIFIEISCHEKDLILYVYNHKVTIRTKIGEPSGLGISNTKTRLNLLYPGKHRLTITDNPKNFEVKLELNLS